MKICFFMHHSVSYRDGASLSLLNIVDELIKSTSYDIVIVFPNDSSKIEYKSNRVKCVYIRTFSMRYPADINNLYSRFTFFLKHIVNKVRTLKISNLLKKENVDIIHINGIDNEVGAAVAKKIGVPYVWHIRQFLEEDLSQTIYNKKEVYNFLKNASAVIGISKTVCEKFRNELNREINLIYNGIPIQNYEIEERHLYNKNNIRFLLAGRICENKGQLDAVKAVKMLVENKIQNLELYIVGYGVDEYVEKVKNYVKTYKLQKYVKFYDYIEDLKVLRKNCDVGLVCSKKEAFGRVTIETFLANMLCIGADTGGTAELINHGVTGLLYQEGNYEDLANKMEYSMKAANYKEVQKIIKRANDFAKDNFSIKRVVREILDIYNEILKRGE